MARATGKAERQTGGRSKVQKAQAAGPASLPRADFIFPPEFLPGNDKKEAPAQLDMFQVTENNVENFYEAPKMAISEPFFNRPPRRQTCAICSAVFDLPPRSTATSCSDECRRIRKQTYGAAYRQQGREMKAKMLAMFGGRRPTEAEFFKMLQQRKGK